MLFHVTLTHTWESCPYSNPEKARTTFGKALSGIGETGASLVGAWVDAPANKFFLVVDADTADQVEEHTIREIDAGRPIRPAPNQTAERLSARLWLGTVKERPATPTTTSKMARRSE